MREVRVNLVAREDLSYSVRIGRGILGETLDRIAAQWPERRVFAVTDANVRDAGHLDALLQGRRVPAYVVDPPGEASKSMATVAEMVEAMERERFGRDSLVVALGGGTVGDMGGFAAAIFKRGVPYVQIPTTTVAQADSSVGGKVGVDSTLSKNAYGAFKQPAVVFVDVATLATMDDRQYRAGLVESVKHGMIADAGYFAFLEANADGLLARDEALLEEVAERNVTIKGKVVEADPGEKGLRRILNYGHTVGHAVESASGFGLLHGEAVAIGIVAAGRIAESMGVADAEVRQRAERLLAKLGMPLKRPSGMSDEALREHMARDKKAVGASPRFVLVNTLGHVHEGGGQYACDVGEDALAAALDAIRP